LKKNFANKEKINVYISSMPGCVFISDLDKKYCFIICLAWSILNNKQEMSLKRQTALNYKGKI